MASSATAAVAAAMGRSWPPWKRTAFWLICRMTPCPALVAPATMASACSTVMTLNAATADAWSTASHTSDCVLTRVTTSPPAPSPRPPRPRLFVDLAGHMGGDGAGGPAHTGTQDVRPVVAAHQAGGQRGREGVTGAGGVAGDAARRAGHPGAAAGRAHEPIRAVGDDDAAGAPGPQFVGRVPEPGGPVDRVLERLGHLGPVGRHDRRALGQGLGQRRSAGVEHDRYGRGGGDPDQGGVGRPVQPGWRTARQGHGRGATEQVAVAVEEQPPFLVRHGRPGLVEHGRVVGVHDRDRAPACPGDRAERVRHPGRVEIGLEHAAAGSPEQAGDRGRDAQLVQDPGDVDALAARALAGHLDRMRSPGAQGGSAVGDVEGGVEADGEDHGGPGSCPTHSAMDSPSGADPSDLSCRTQFAVCAILGAPACLAGRVVATQRRAPGDNSDGAVAQLVRAADS